MSIAKEEVRKIKWTEVAWNDLKEEAVYIIGFIHGARDMWALWKREERSYSEDVG